MNEVRRGHRPPNGEAVLDRAFRLLAAFTPARPRLTLTELSTIANLPLSTASRLSGKLVSLGALERRPDGAYSLGLRLLEFAALAPRGHGLRAIALPYMEDLHRATRQHVQLAVREDDEAVIVERLSAPGAAKVLYHVGGRVPLHATGLGNILLAHTKPGFQEAYLRRPLRLDPEDTLMDPVELRDRLALIRRTGVATMTRLLPEPAASVAAPILDGDRKVVAALSVVGTDGSLDVRMLEPAVMAIAASISREVGARAATQ
ncbi:IclR family transcriptional regulator [Agromyces intestinalis]|uniref:IclR family transcriptional regulator n=1 Tax=Agromyces intestinalis TaxID=2592652 RepID=A0A5C1YCZ9_9MICO|nr:IclR family transcriptional regulator [Agromyces intestinalis]QEO13886.1 IclR family transcriptional regulator [Agromyces intestinalis]